MVQLLLDASWRNDQLFFPAGVRDRFYPGDDDGFTNDFLLKLGADWAGEHSIAISALHRMITERDPRWGEEDLRVDQLDAAASYKRRVARGSLTFSASASGGVRLVGPLGGMQIQQYWHTGPIARGRTIGHGLQDNYEPRLSVAPLVGADLGVDYRPLSWLTLSAASDVSAGVGSMGVVGAEATVRVQVPENPLVVRPFIAATARGVGQAVTDERLSLPGGYVSGFHFTPSVAVGATAGPLTLGFDLRWNEGGAGHGMGETKLSLAF